MREKRFGQEVSGNIVGKNEWPQIFTKVLRKSPDLFLYDGLDEYSSQILKHKTAHKDEQVLIIDETLPRLPKRFFDLKTTVLGKTQYFESGLIHRLSFTLEISKQFEFSHHQAIWTTIQPPMRKSSSLFIASPSVDRPVFMEIPISGAPPQVRIIDLSTENIRALSPSAQKLFPKSREINGMRVQFVDLGETLVDGTISASSDDELQIKLDHLTSSSLRLFEQYLEEEYEISKSKEHSFSNVQEITDNKLVESSKAVAEEIERSTPAAVIVLKDRDLREQYCRIMDEFEYRSRTLERFEQVTPEVLEGRSLFIFDVRQEGGHSVDFLKSWLKNGSINRGQFILVGDNPNKSRQEEWHRLGDGLFLGSNTPLMLLRQRIGELIHRVRRPGE